MEAYYDDIYHILEKNTKAGKFISPKHITEIFYLVREKEDLRRYVNFLMFVDKFNAKEDSTAMFSIKDKTIIFSKEALHRFCKEMVAGSKLKGLDLSLFRDESSIFILLHELEHVKQTKYLVESTEYDIKYELLKMATLYIYVYEMSTLYGDDHIINYYGATLENYYGKDYKRFLRQVDKLDKKFNLLYDFDPAEINADFNAIDTICSFNQSDALRKEWMKTFITYVRDYYSDNRGNLVAPLKEYVKKRNKIVTLDKIELEDYEDYSLPLKLRFSFGMPIKKKECHSIGKTLKKRQ